MTQARRVRCGPVDARRAASSVALPLAQPAEAASSSSQASWPPLPALALAVALAVAQSADELLDAAAVDRLAGVEVALRVLRHGVQERELAGLHGPACRSRSRIVPARRSMMQHVSLPPSASNMIVCARSLEKSRSQAEPAVPSPATPPMPSVTPVPGTTGMIALQLARSCRTPGCGRLRDRTRRPGRLCRPPRSADGRRHRTRTGPASRSPDR